MKRLPQLLLFASGLLCLVTNLAQGGTRDEIRKPYIVYMGDVPAFADTSALADEHHGLLVEAIGDEETARASKTYSFGKSFNGFVASLLPHEADVLSMHDRTVSVFESQIRKLRTTRSWDFLGMPLEKTRRNPAIESNLIIGLLDTGIYPEAPSFNPRGYGPIPSTWKGNCTTAYNFTGCNNKIIGATFYDLINSAEASGLELSPIDQLGHGSHTSSIAAGNVVHKASLYGIAEGTARGGVPRARIAMYKVCWYFCADADILAGFDDAIHDGVDVISMSVGGWSGDYFSDVIAIGAFHAMKRGILTSCSAGNNGPSLYSVENVAPWIFTTAANSIDRTFISTVKLGNGKEYAGFAINTFAPNKTTYPLTTGSIARNITANYPSGNSSNCAFGTMDESKVTGRIVYCQGFTYQDSDIQMLGGAGTIMSTDVSFDLLPETLIPATVVNSEDGYKIDRYARFTKNPQAVIYRTKTTRMKAPAVASFSSRGPQSISLNILKPDISAPGLHILAGYSKITTVSNYLDVDDRHVVFSILSGTSMSCPHVSAAAVYVKTFWPKWSPAAIKSALMTTATPMVIEDGFGELSYGAGQINPTMATRPGLVYDIAPHSYIAFLCKEGYNDTQISLLSGDKSKKGCSSYQPAQGSDGLNYPSMHAQLKYNETKVSAEFHRTVTNVGYKNSTYQARITSFKELGVSVDPSVLRFNKLGQQLSFKVKVSGTFGTGMQVLRAALEWNDGHHTVRSPIMVFRE